MERVSAQKFFLSIFLIPEKSGEGLAGKGLKKKNPLFNNY